MIELRFILLLLLAHFLLLGQCTKLRSSLTVTLPQELHINFVAKFGVFCLVRTLLKLLLLTFVLAFIVRVGRQIKLDDPS